MYHYDDNDCDYSCKTISKTADLIDRFLDTVKREANKQKLEEYLRTSTKIDKIERIIDKLEKD